MVEEKAGGTEQRAGGGPRVRVRIRYGKGEAIKYLSHLDLARTWERAFRRARLPLAYSQGFNPRPRYQLAAALPVGVTGRQELLDMWLVEALEPDEVLRRLRPALPPGLEAAWAGEVELGEPALQAEMRSAEYRAVVRSPEAVESIRGRAQALLEARALPRRRQHKGEWQTYDLRPLVQELAVEPAAGGEATVWMRLQASPEGAGRPDEVLEVLGLTLATRSVERTALHFAVLGALRS